MLDDVYCCLSVFYAGFFHVPVLLVKFLSEGALHFPPERLHHLCSGCCVSNTLTIVAHLYLCESQSD